MACILNIETSTPICSVALCYDGAILEHYEDFKGTNHAAVLSDFIKGCLDHLQRHNLKLDAIAVSAGPGSYTGLRIGLSEAKGLAYALNIPLIQIDTLKIMAVNAMFNHDIPENGIFNPMIDARRMEVYTALYNLPLETIMAPAPVIIPEAIERSTAPDSHIPDYLEPVIKDHEIFIFGNGSDKTRDIISATNIYFLDAIHPLATYMQPLSDQAYRAGSFADLAYSTPIYLKDFQATKPKSRL